jgi:NTP pyrophosphatase (non-canonical NTP hydrolase)
VDQKDSIVDLEAKILAFSEKRDWDQFHTPKNLIMAATSEMGELAEVLQWMNDSEAAVFLSTQSGRERISEEIADVAIYLIRLCQKLDLNFVEILSEKIKQNDLKYPVEKSKGSANKYTDL